MVHLRPDGGPVHYPGSFGTACNVSGDNAIAVIVDKIYKTWIKNNFCQKRSISI